MENEKSMNVVVLLAGGSGTRMKSNVAKQHIVVENHQIIEYTLKAFSSSDDVDGIFVVSNPNYYTENLLLKSQFPKLFHIIKGGSNRAESVYNAVSFLASICKDDDKVIISDAVRPCITLRETHEIYKSLDEYDAVTTGVEVYETILKTDCLELKEIIQREGVFRQTSPEGYKYRKLYDLYIRTPLEKVQQYKNIGIDQLFAYGENIGLIKSTPLNFKITTQEDLYYFETVLKKGFDAILNS